MKFKTNVNMKISEFKNILNTINTLQFSLENGNLIPKHFHITEVGEISKKYIDCGGSTRAQRCINFQLWFANDLEHRLSPQKIIDILDYSTSTLNLDDLEIEVEYQSNTIGKYGLSFDGTSFILLSKQTNCLDLEKCGISTPIKEKVSLSNLKTSPPTCSPDSGCC